MGYEQLSCVKCTFSLPILPRCHPGVIIAHEADGPKCLISSGIFAIGVTFMFSAETGFRTVQLCFIAQIDKRLDNRIPIDERPRAKSSTGRRQGLWDVLTESSDLLGLHRLPPA